MSKNLQCRVSGSVYAMVSVTVSLLLDREPSYSLSTASSSFPSARARQMEFRLRVLSVKIRRNVL